MSSEPTPVEVRSLFVRNRNVLVLEAIFEPLFVDLYLHWMQHGLHYPSEIADLQKDLIAAQVLYLTSRPWSEAAAWTMHTNEPPLNFFVSGDNQLGNITGRIFTENVKVQEKSLFFAQIVSRGVTVRQSVTEIKEVSAFSILEEFYLNSEQRPAKFYHLGGDRYVMLVAQPDYDEAWFESIDIEKAKIFDQEETLALLETRSYKFHCGCSLERILPALGAVTANHIDDLFEGDEQITIHCPRCCAHYELHRQTLLDWISQKEAESKNEGSKDEA